MTGSVLAGLALDESVVEVASSTEEVTQYLAAILSRLGYPDQANGSLRVSVLTLPTLASVTTVTTVTTVSTVTNLAQVGGFSAAYDQYSQMMAGAYAIRQQIVVS